MTTYYKVTYLYGVRIRQLHIDVQRKRKKKKNDNVLYDDTVRRRTEEHANTLKEILYMGPHSVSHETRTRTHTWNHRNELMT